MRRLLPSKQEMLTQCVCYAVPPSPTLAHHYFNIDSACCVCWVSGPVSAAESPTTLCPANTTRYPNSGSTLLPIWPATIQHWAVLSASVGLSTEYKLTPTQYLLNAGPAWPVLASIHSALGSVSCWRE